jgi:hypothetical protein
MGTILSNGTSSYVATKRAARVMLAFEHMITFADIPTFRCFDPSVKRRAMAKSIANPHLMHHIST